MKSNRLAATAFLAALATVLTATQARGRISIDDIKQAVVQEIDVDVDELRAFAGDHSVASVFDAGGLIAGTSPLIETITRSILGDVPADDLQCNTDFRAPNVGLQINVIASIRHRVIGTENICKKFSASSVAYDPGTRRLFIANPFDALLEIYDIQDPSRPFLVREPVRLGGDTCNPISPLRCSRPNHVAAANGVVAVTVIDVSSTNPGRLVLMDTNGTILNELVVGFSPTWVAFTSDGTKIVVANQGMPSDDYQFDPEGSFSIIENWASSTPSVTPVTLAEFNDRKSELIDQGVRIYGPCLSSTPQPCEVTVAQDLEPVLLVISPDSTQAWVSFETNNALGILDLIARRVTNIRSFGIKDHGKWRNRIDATVDDAFDLHPWPVYGLYQPNGIDVFRAQGRQYLITANRGNWRENSALPDATERMTVAAACAAGKLDAQLCYQTPINGVQGLAAGVPTLSIARYPYRYEADPAASLPAPFTYGGRSFAIWTLDGKLVHDSGARLEAITHRACPRYFNSQSDQNTFDDRSDDKGPEPEGVVTADMGGRRFAFVTLRRIGGIVAFDISQPRSPIFQQYINNRDFGVDPKDLDELPPWLPIPEPSRYFVNCAAGDLQAVKPVFIPASDAPGGQSLLFVVHDYSGSVTIFRILGE